MQKKKWVKVGEVGVDSGMVMIGDPCYIGTTPDLCKENKKGLSVKGKEPFKNWHEFCDYTEEERQKGKQTFEFNEAVVSQTAYGDGSYPVFALLDEHGTVHGLKVKFN